MRHLCNCWSLEELRNAKLNLRNFEYMAEDVGSQKRVSAQAEEVIVNADPFDLKDLSPVSSQHRFEGCAWRDEFAPLGGAAREPQFRRQAGTLHFPGRA